MKRYGLLVVDDEIHILRTLALTFKEDYRVFTATPVGLRPWGSWSSRRLRSSSRTNGCLK